MSTRKNAVNTEGVAEPFNIAEVPWIEHGRGKRFGIEYQVLSEFAGATQITVCMEVLPAGKQANQAHYHLLEEEHIFVLEGSMTVRLGEKFFVVASGGYVCFPAGQKVAHSITTHTDVPCRYLILGNVQKNDVIVYPDTARVWVKAVDASYHTSPTMRYWDGVTD